MPITRSGVYHDLQESTFTASNIEAVFFFSSEFYRDKFLKEYKPYRDDMMKRMESVNPTFYKYFKDRLYFYYDVRLYKSIEKRGFRVIVKGCEMNWQAVQKYALQERINTNIVDWSTTPVQK